MYVLDEPSIGLHQRDNERLIETLRHLRDLGNSVLVVEHDEDTIRACDHVIDLDRDPGLAARSSEASLRGSIARNLSAATFQPMTMPHVASSSLPLRQASLGVQSVLSPSLRVSRTHVLRC
jgi:ABC-type Mn2+/Zn2+ transport system ATPase subunit